MRPYDTLIDEVPNGGVYAAGYRNSDGAANPYNNNTGQESQIAVTNAAEGIALTVDYQIGDNMAAKLLLSDRHSEYQSGLDDDGFFDDFLSFPEKGEADQQSAELQLTGEFGAFDYVAGLYWFEEEGKNDQDPTIFLGGPGDFLLSQKVDSQAIYGNVGYHFTDALRVSAGLRYTQDDKTAGININSGLIVDTSSRDWSETSWDLSANYQLNDRMNVYGTIQSGYQSGQFPPRPFCLFGFVDFSQTPPALNPVNCFEANDNVTALNYEVGLKGQPFDNLQMSVAVFYTDYSDLPYQVSETLPGAGFDTRNIFVDQTSVGVEWEGIWQVTDAFRIHSTLGYIDTSADEQVTDPNNPPPQAVAPLTPEITFSLSPVVHVPAWQRQPDSARRLFVPRRHVRRAERRPGPLHPDRQPRPGQLRHHLRARGRRLDGLRLRQERHGRALRQRAPQHGRLRDRDPVERRQRVRGACHAGFLTARIAGFSRRCPMRPTAAE